MEEARERVDIEEAGLVRLSREGDAEAFGSLVVMHQKKVFNLVLRMLGDYEEACDVAQDAFVAAFRAMDGFRGGSSFRTWVSSIALNLARNRLKSLGRQAKREADPPGNPGSAVHEPASQSPSALDELEAKSTRQHVGECLGELQPEFREVIVLRDVQGYTYTEISGITGSPEGTVKSRLARARDSVRDCLKKKMGDLR